MSKFTTVAVDNTHHLVLKYSLLFQRTCRNSLTVAVDGSLFKKHPTFKRYMQQTLDELLPWTRVKLRLAEDGSGIGAAMVAAVAQKHEQ